MYSTENYADRPLAPLAAHKGTTVLCTTCTGQLIQKQYTSHACTYIRTYVCMYIHTYVHMYVCTYKRTYVCAYVHAYDVYHFHMYAHMYVRVYVDVCHAVTLTAHLLHFVKSCHLYPSDVSEVGCLDDLIQSLTGCQTKALLFDTANPKQHRQSVHENFSVALLGPGGEYVQDRK